MDAQACSASNYHHTSNVVPNRTKLRPLPTDLAKSVSRWSLCVAEYILAAWHEGAFSAQYTVTYAWGKVSEPTSSLVSFS